MSLAKTKKPTRGQNHPNTLKIYQHEVPVLVADLQRVLMALPRVKNLTGLQQQLYMHETTKLIFSVSKKARSNSDKPQFPVKLAAAGAYALYCVLQLFPLTFFSDHNCIRKILAVLDRMDKSKMFV